MFSNIVTTTTESKLVDLGLDLVRSVAEEDGGVGVTGRHLGPGSLQGGEEDGVDESRLEVTQSRSHVTCHSEVWVLVNGTGNQTGNISLATKYEGKCGAEGRSSLNCRETDLANRAALVKSENSLKLYVVIP